MSKRNRIIPVFLSAVFCAAIALGEDAQPAAAPGQAIVKPAPTAAPQAPAKSGAQTAAPQAPAKPAAQTAAPQTTTKPAGPATPVQTTVKPAEAPAAPSIPVKSAEPQTKGLPTPAEAPGIPEIIAPAPKKEAAKELGSCAKSLLPLAEGYKRAYEDLQAWAQEVNTRTADAETKVQNVEGQIQKNEAEITKLKITGDKDGKVRIKELTQSNKQLWKELKAARKERASLCSEFSKTTERKVKEYATDIDERFKTTRSQMR